RLGDALAKAGRGAESAREYLMAAVRTTVAEALELKRRAAMQLLISGHVDEGMAVLRTLLREIGMRLPSTPRRALWSLLLLRAQVRLRGLGFRIRDESRLSAEVLTRIDICWTAAIGLTNTDYIYGALFQAHHILLALHA